MSELELSRQIERLTQQVEALENRITGLMFRLSDAGPTPDEYLIEERGREPSRDALRTPRTPLPDPRLLRKIIRQRRLRARYFEKELFADPAWDILLDLCAARAEHRLVSVTSLCIAAAVPETTALRWIAMMEKMGLLVRTKDPDHGRRSYIGLSDEVAQAMSRYLDEVGKGASSLI